MKPAALLALLALSITLTGQEADRARTEALARRADERLQALHQEADRLASQERTLLGELRKLELQRQIKTEELHQLDSQAAAAARDLSAVDTEVTRLEHEEEAARPELKSRLVELYKLGEARYLRMMLGLTDVRHVVGATRMVAVVARRDHDQIVAHQRRLGDLARSRRDLEDRSEALVHLHADADKARAGVDQAVDERNALVTDIDRRRDLNAQLAGELQAAQQSLQVRLRDAAAGTGSAEPLALPLRPFQGELDWPVAGAVRQRFGRVSGVAGGSENGIEIAAGEGASVHAVHDGTVAFADTFSGFGKLVIVDHGGQSFSIYGNLGDILVAKGDRLDGGQPIGTVGTSVLGAAGLHFELRVDARPVDPLQWLKKR